jgi:NhaP-type Na+/H+ or K+/H+ antiporter
MRFLVGLLPGLLIGIALGLTGTALVRHARPVAKALVKASIVTGSALGALVARARGRVAVLISEARAELAQAREEKEAELAGPWAEHDIGRRPADGRDERPR